MNGWINGWLVGPLKARYHDWALNGKVTGIYACFWRDRVPSLVELQADGELEQLIRVLSYERRTEYSMRSGRISEGYMRGIYFEQL
jgi:hypothetical protein